MDKKNITAFLLSGANTGLNNRMCLVATSETGKFCHSSDQPDYIEATKNRGIKRYIAFASVSNLKSRLMTCKSFQLSNDVQIRKIVIGTLVTTKSGTN